MIIQDREKLKVACRETTIEECQLLDVFSKLGIELENSPTAGVGLSANQLGLDVRACIIRCDDTKLNMVNPRVVETYDKFCHCNEGCLSFPGIRIDTDRYKGCLVEWLDYDEKIERRAVFYYYNDPTMPGKGFDSIAVQHEIDHLNGFTIENRRHISGVKVGRNDPCLCGSGKKYKKCCLK